MKGRFFPLFFSIPTAPPWPSPSLNEVVFQYVQAAHHLGKDKHPVATSLQFGQQLVNQHELASSLDHRLELKIWRVCTVCFFKLFQNFLFSTCRDWTAKREYCKRLLLKTMNLLSKPTAKCKNQNVILMFPNMNPFTCSKLGLHKTGKVEKASKF